MRTRHTLAIVALLAAAAISTAERSPPVDEVTVSAPVLAYAPTADADAYALGVGFAPDRAEFVPIARIEVAAVQSAFAPLIDLGEYPSRLYPALHTSNGLDTSTTGRAFAGGRRSST